MLNAPLGINGLRGTTSNRSSSFPIPKLFIGQSIFIFSFKKEGEPCNCCELIIGNKEIAYVETGFIFFT